MRQGEFSEVGDTQAESLRQEIHHVGGSNNI